MLIIHNANINPQNTSQPSASAIAIDGEHIIAVGSEEEILSGYNKATRINARGKTILPGLTDAHIHLESFAFSLQKVDCETPTQSECLSRVSDRVGVTQPGEWVLGHGWNQNNWTESYGTAQQLDQIAPENPVYLTHKSLHCGWANSAALRCSGIDSATTDPIGGRIGRSDTGEPNGIVFESAMELIDAAIPEPSLEDAVQAIQEAIPILWKVGLTGIHDFDHQRCFSALQVLNQSHELKLRVVKSIPRENLEHAISTGLRTHFGDDMLQIGSVKLFSDGALGPHTAAMLESYESDPGNIGLLMLDSDELFEIGKKASDNGISLAVHAIGDRANREVLNGFAQLREYERQKHLDSIRLQHRVEHVQIIHPTDAKRFSELDVIASMQPIHATSDMLMADQFWGRRSAFAYAWREQLNHGSLLIFGSDAPVESPNPFWGIHAAVTRRRADGSPSTDGWYPEQRLNVQEAIQAYTNGPALASGMGNSLGKLATGFLADLVIIDKDPFSCPSEELIDIHPLATMVGGEWVYYNLE